MNINACLSHKSDHWRTPSKLYEYFVTIRGYFDPCPYKSDFDGLSIDWHLYNFVNPPYSDISKWINKSVNEFEKGNTIVMLLPFRPDTQWFKIIFFNKAAQIYFIEGRLKFNDSNSAPFPSVLVVFNPIARVGFGSSKICYYLSRKDLENLCF